MNDEDKETLAVASKLYLSAELADDHYAMFIALSAIVHLRQKKLAAEQLN